MSVLDYVLGGILLLAAVFLVVAVLMQEGKSKGMGGAISGGVSDTFYGRKKGKSWERWLPKLTTIVGIAFVVIVLLVYIIQDDADYDKFFDDNKGALENPVEETEPETTGAAVTTAPASSSETTGPAATTAG